MNLTLSWTTIFILFSAGFVVGWITSKSLWPYVVGKIKSAYHSVRGN